jgi:predicted kinase
MLIVVAGLPGSGKSTLALDLGRALNCAVLGVDQAEAAMWRAGVSKTGPTHHAAYLVVGALAAEQLALGHDVIVDAVNGPEPARAQWRDLAAQLEAELRFIVVECSDDRIFRDRLAHRVREIEGFPEPTWEGVLRRRAEFPPWTDDRLVVDSVNSRETNLQAALDYLPSGLCRPGSAERGSAERGSAEPGSAEPGSAEPGAEIG